MSFAQPLLVIGTGACIAIAGVLIKYFGHMNLIAGYDPDAVADEEGLADFVGINTLYIAGLTILIGAADYVTTSDSTQWYWLVYAAIVVLLAVRMIRGARRYEYPRDETSYRDHLSPTTGLIPAGVKLPNSQTKIWQYRDMASRKFLSVLFRDNTQRLRLPWRLLWNTRQRRLRSPIRLVVGFVLILLFTAIGNSYSPRVIATDGVFASVINNIVRELPRAIFTLAGVYLASRWIDRRWVTNLGLDTDQDWWRELGVGIVLGLGIATLSAVVALLAGWYTLSGIRITTEPLQWLLLAIGAAVFQLTFVVPEELFVRGYLISNVAEGLDGLSAVPRGVAAGAGVVLSSLVFYYTHTAGLPEATVWFGFMAGSLAALLGIGYILTGNLALPIGVHFGVNFAGVLLGSNPQPASALRLTANSLSIRPNSLLTREFVIVQILGALLSVGIIVWWCRSRDGQLRIAPSVTVPALRWRAQGDGNDSNH